MNRTFRRSFAAVSLLAVTCFALPAPRARALDWAPLQRIASLLGLPVAAPVPAKTVGKSVGKVVPRALTFTVDDTNDFSDEIPGDNACTTDLGGCTLRAAIEEANATAGDDTINFAIPGTGVQSIAPGTLPLPIITEALTINGYTQLGSSANTLAVGNDASLQIELDGSDVFTEVGLEIEAPNCVIKGLVIKNFAEGIHFGPNLATGNVVSGCFIGTDADGTTASANSIGVRLHFGANLNTIGGPNPADRNLISGNSIGVLIHEAGTTNNLVEGNYIGTDRTGLVALPNTTGVSLQQVGNTVQSNLISGNTGSGIHDLGDGTANVIGNTIQNNTIGLDATESDVLGNSDGILIDERDNTVVQFNIIGGNTSCGITLLSNSAVGPEGVDIISNDLGTNFNNDPGLGNTFDGIFLGASGCTVMSNVILGNGTHGIEIQNATDNIIQQNNIGLAGVGNTGSGILLGLGAQNNIIGGSPTDTFANAQAAGNLVTGNATGVKVFSGSNNATGNCIRGNTIENNTILGINLVGGSEDTNGVTANDGLDADAGNNGLQNFPVITGVSGTTINGTLNSTASSSFVIECFSSAAAAPSGFGEGSTGLGAVSVTTNASGNATFSVTAGTAPTGVVTATATNLTTGETSEFSAAVLAPSNYEVDTTSDIAVAGGCTSRTAGDCSLREAITASNASIGLADTISFNIPGAGPQPISVPVGPANALPTITDAVTIDGYTQGGATVNTLAVGSNAVINIEINGNTSGPTSTGPGLLIQAPNCVVKGLSIINFGSSAVKISGAAATNNTVEGCWLGISSDGVVSGNSEGVRMENGATNNTIGGTSPTARNVISGNILGVTTSGATTNNNVIAGNYIGTDVFGTLAVPNTDGVTIIGSGNMVGVAGGGNLISGNTQEGVVLGSTASLNTKIQGNLIGLNVNGADLGNGQEGIFIQLANGTLVGGTSAALRNVISGNGAVGILIQGIGATDVNTRNNIISGNFIGTNLAGSAAIGNGSAGIRITAGPTNNTIGGSTTASRNVISGNSSAGVDISANGNTVQGNHIGTNESGTAAIPNASGVSINGDANIIGNAAGGVFNVISGNTTHGISILSATSAASNQVHNNHIGVAFDGTSALANGGDGIFLTLLASNTQVGAGTAAAANIIAFNGGSGIRHTGTRTGNAFRRNSIFGNGGLGIALGGADVTANDAGDADTGPNDLQNFPVITSVNGTTISGTLNSTASTTFALDFYESTTADPTGFGEGQTFLGTTNVTTNAGGDATFSFTAGTAPSGAVSATATNSTTNNTSEFSQVTRSLSVVTWNGGAGSWSDTSKWTGLPGGVAFPNNGTPLGAVYDVRIDGSKTGTVSTVAVDVDVAVSKMTVDAGDVVGVNNRHSFTLANTGSGTGTITNNGEISLNSGSVGGDFATLVISGNVTLAGTGKVTLGDFNGTTFNFLVGTGANRLTNGASHTIQGSGNIGANSLFITNLGTILKNGTSDLAIDPADGASGFINGGILRSTTGTLFLSGGSFVNTGNSIEAQGTSTIAINSSDVTAGTISVATGCGVTLNGVVLNQTALTTAGTGTITHVGNSTLNGPLTSNAAFGVNNRTTLTVSGAITNNGEIKLNSGPIGGDFAVLSISGDVTLAGTGIVTLGDAGGTTFNFIGGTGTNRLTNGATHTIQGSGNIGSNNLFVTNLGSILKNGTTDLTIDPANGATGFINGGILRSSVGTLFIGDGSFDNTGKSIQAQGASTIVISSSDIKAGTISAATGCAVTLNGVTINQSTLSTAGTGTFTQVGNSTLNGPLTNNAAFGVNNRTTLTVSGAITNNGEIKLNSGAAGGDFAVLSITGNITLAGTGRVTLGDAGGTTFNFIGGTGTNRLTNGASHTFQGSGNIGSNNLFITNLGSILKNGTADLTIDAADGAGGFTNSGLVTVSTGTLGVAGTDAYLQTAGTTTVNGTLNLSAMALQGGTLKGGGTVNGSVNNSGGIVSPGTSPGILTENGNYTQSGTGALTMELTGATVGTQYDQLKVNGTVTLGGPLNVTAGFAPTVGTPFVLIDNDGTDAVTGTFTGRPQNAAVTVNGLPYRISYTGGDGNDVVLTRVALPTPSISDVVADYSPTNNPNGVWSYGFSTTRGTAFNLDPNHTVDFLPGLDNWSGTANGPFVSHNKTGVTQNFSTVSLPPDMLSLDPSFDGRNSVVRWTAPQTGNYFVSGRFQGLDTGGTTTDAAILKNTSSEVFSGNVNGFGTQLPFSLTVALAAGDTLDFSVGQGSSGSLNDSTGLAALISPNSLSVGDVTLTEGDTGTAMASFTVTLSAASTSTVTVDFATANNTATQPADYTQRTGTTTFTPGQTVQVITVPVAGDILDEANESFFVNLTNPTNSLVSDAQGVCTIADNDVSPSLTINDPTVLEGNTGTVNLNFVVSLSSVSGRAVLVNFATVAGTAIAPNDFTAATGTLTIPAGQPSGTVTIPVVGDLLDELDETVLLNLSGNVNATIFDNQGLGVITDDDAPPTVSINDVTVAEGNSGTTNAVFTVTLSAVSGRDVSVNFATANSTAVQPADYTLTTSTLVILAGQTTGTIIVPVVGDVLDEANETFFVNLTIPSNATINDAQGVGTITDNDALPAISINDVTMTEGSGSVTSATFTVTLTPASGRGLTVDFATANGTAVQPGDYTPQTGTLSFAAGQTTKTITVPVTGDVLDEPNETVLVNLTNPVNATIADAQGVGTINDDDATPTVSISNSTVAEGNTGTPPFATFVVTLSAASGRAVTVNFATANGTATVGSDFTAATGTLTFNAGQTSKNVFVSLVPDTTAELDETFFVNLTAPSNATLADAQGLGTITNDDGALPQDFVVDNTLDGNLNGCTATANDCSLRGAINAANAKAGLDTITFNIPASGVQTIAPATPLPVPTEKLVIDGTTQPGFAGSPLIFISGANPGAGSGVGLDLSIGDSTVKGLTISGFFAAIEMAGSTAKNNKVEGCWIGLNPTGTAAFATTNFIGVKIGGTATNNVIGGPLPTQRNVISGSGGGGPGVWITENGTTGNVVHGNFIGTDKTGLTAVPSARGVLIDGEASGNFVGRNNIGNTISGNQFTGVEISGAGTNGNRVESNFIGLNQNDVALANGGSGVEINGAASNNVVGGSVAAQRNVLSGNTAYGIAISQAGTNGNSVTGNLIGTNGAGTAARPNGINGVAVFDGAQNNIIGGTTVATGNVISGNAVDGVSVSDTAANGNTVRGNLIGLAVNGISALPNLRFGVTVFGSAQNNTVGGLSAGSGNIISGNGLGGLVISDAGTTGTNVQGNIIGLNTAGAAVGNGAFQPGVTIQSGAANNTIGGTVAGAGNLISGNQGAGITIAEAGTTANRVMGNKIGTNAAGDAAIANGNGVLINNGAASNIIGGTTAGSGNLISGNLAGSGVGIGGASTTLNQVLGNTLGTNLAGTAALPNRFGVAIFSGVNNTIGGATAAARNLISGNIDNNVILDGAATNKLLGNFIGTNLAGTAALNNTQSTSGGVSLNNASTGNEIGGISPGQGNLISGNNSAGVIITNSSANNLVRGNLIGTNAAGTGAVGNQGSGVVIHGSNNVIGGGNLIGSVRSGAGNLISNNRDHGILVASGVGNFMRGNLIMGNGGLAIDLNNDNVTANDATDSDTGPNNLQNFANIGSVVQTGNNLRVLGSMQGVANTTYLLDFYAQNTPDEFGHGEGDIRLIGASAPTNSLGLIAFDFPIAVTQSFVGKTVSVIATDPAGNTSEFSANVVVGAAPAISISDVSRAEGNAGTSNMTFNVTLSAASAQDVTVNFATANGTAIEPGDYTNTTGTLTFAPGETTKPINVPVVGDNGIEPNETFLVNLTVPVGATLADGQGAGTINNDDTIVSVTVAPASVVEDGAPNLVFTFTRAGVTSGALTVAFSVGGTAGFGTDYTQTGAATFNATSGTVNFAAGATTATVTIDPTADSTFEAAETAILTVVGGTGYMVTAPSAATGSITNDDAAALPTLSINDSTVTEDDFEPIDATFTVTLSAASTSTVRVNFATANGTATAPGDYTLASGTLIFAPGVTSQTISVETLPDDAVEPNETFFVNLTSPVGATIADGQGLGTITNDDVAPLPTLAINNVTVTEGNAGTTNATFNVALSAASTSTVTVNFATANDSAIAPGDYTPTTGTLTFAPGETAKSVNVPVVGDTAVESNETFFVNLTAPTGATIADAQGLGTIEDDDVAPLPTLAINNVTLNEGNTGTTNATFNVTLSAASTSTVTVNFATANQTAIAPGDFTAATGTLTFAPGQTTRPISVPVVGDIAVEPTETFLVNLTAPSNATIADGQGVGTITNDDVAATNIFVVTKTADTNDGACDADCSLREAIVASNANGSAAADTIRFAIPGSGVKTIVPLTALPALATPVTMNGGSQSGYTVDRPLIEIEGGAVNIGLTLTAANSRVIGLIINRSQQANLLISGATATNNRVQACWLGPDDNGGISSRANNAGVQIAGGATGNIIGGSSAAVRNIISGNGRGVLITGAGTNANQVLGNFIGTEKTGTSAVANDGGVEIAAGASANVVGAGGASGNVISGSGNGGSGVQINAASGNFVRNNVIGLRADSGAALANAGDGIQFIGTANNNIIEDNVIAGNQGNGVTLLGSGNQLLANFIGVNASGAALANRANGVAVTGGTALIIGTTTDGNTIRSNSGAGVAVSGNARGVSVRGNTLIGNGGDGVSVANTAAGVTVRSNHIFNNGQLGIDLVAAGDPVNGVTANDLGTPPDADTGPNGLQNFPVITALAQAAAGQPLLFKGSLRSMPNKTFIIDAYLSSAKDPSNFGEGENAVASFSVITNANGAVSFTRSVAQGGSVSGQFLSLTATATDTSGAATDTSEFSPVRVVPPSSGLEILDEEFDSFEVAPCGSLKLTAKVGGISVSNVNWTVASGGTPVAGLTGTGHSFDFIAPSTGTSFQVTATLTGGPPVTDTVTVRVTAQPTEFFGWGHNSLGSVGDGSTTNRHAPVTLSLGDNPDQIAAGGGHSLALIQREGGSQLFAWGNNVNGQLGNGGTTASATPVDISARLQAAGASPDNITSLACGWYHSLVIVNGEVWAWGYNRYGQVGQPAGADQLAPAKVPGLTNVVQVAGGVYFSLARKADGTVWAWGNNTYGQCGPNARAADVFTPVQVLSGASFIAAGGAHGAAIVGGQVMTWGSNESGQLGNGVSGFGRQSATPVRAGTLAGVTSLAAGYSHNTALAASGPHSWGDNSQNQLGRAISGTHSPTPGFIPGLTNVAKLFAGSGHNIALLGDQTVRGWGYNAFGSLGLGDTDTYDAPTLVPNLKNVTDVAAGYGHTLAVAKEDLCVTPVGPIKAPLSLTERPAKVSASAVVSSDTVILDGITAPAHFTVKVNGKEVSVVGTQNTDGAVTVLLKTGALKVGDDVKISWQGLATGSAECEAE